MATGVIKSVTNGGSFGSVFCTDLNSVNSITGRLILSSTNETSLNTPYKAGLTGGAVAGETLSYFNSTNWGTQLSFATGMTDLFVRALSNGTWSSWRKI